MKKKTIFLLTVVMALLAMPYRAFCSQNATGEVLCMVISHNDGTVSKFALADSPKVTYEGNSLVVTSATADLTTDLSGIEKWTFEMADIDGISETETATPQASIAFGRAEISGLAPGAVVGIYGIDGKTVKQVKCDATGRVLIDLGNLPGGAYILRTPQQSYKFINRK